MDAGHYDTERKENPKKRANFFSKLFFLYTWDVFVKGRKRKFYMDDVYKCGFSNQAAYRGDQLNVTWSKEKVKENPSFIRAIFAVHGTEFVIWNVLFSIADVALRMIVPMFLERLITYFSSNNSGITTQEAYYYAAGLFIVSFLNVLIVHPLVFWLFQLSLRVRASSCSLLYRKLLNLDLTAGGSATEGLAGHFVNLLTNDAQQFDSAFLFVTDLVRTPIETVLIIYLMYRQIGVSVLVGVGFILFVVPFQGVLSHVISRLRFKTAKRTDYRIRVMSECIQSIEAIKMYVWEKAFSKFIGYARMKEMNILRKVAYCKAVSIMCINVNAKIAVFLSLLVFFLLDNDVTAAKVFVIFTYFDFLKQSLVEFFPNAITSTLEMMVSIRRFQNFLLLPEVEKRANLDNVNGPSDLMEKVGNGLSETVMDKPMEADRGTLISLEKYTTYWKGNEKGIALSEIDLKIKAGTLTCVVGTVGSGKSTLFHAILKELSPTSGSIAVRCKVSYASQEPWLFEASVRQNIIFGKKMDLRRYKQVIDCCQLKPDFKKLSYGDKTVIREGGASLSGGQRARISLARCIYQQADVYLLDDPLAAVDAKVALALFEDCVRMFLRQKAVVLVTHQTQYAVTSDNIVVMKDGKIAAQGTYNELKANTAIDFHGLLQNTAEENVDTKPEGDVVRKDFMRLGSLTSMSSSNVDFEYLEPEYEGEQYNRGAVKSNTYWDYFKIGGGTRSVATLFMVFVFCQLVYSSTDYWLKIWVNVLQAQSVSISNGNLTAQNNFTGQNISETDPLAYEETLGLTGGQYTQIYAALIVACIFITLYKLISFFNTFIKTSINMHDSMFKGVVHAPMTFFYNNPSGRILNRFSKDIGIVDTSLPQSLMYCATFFMEVSAVLIVVCLVNWLLVIPTTAMGFVLLYLRKVFLDISRELKRFESITRSEVINHSTATISGLPTIRSTNEQKTLAREFDAHQDLNSSVTVIILSTNRAFGLWMDVICCVYLGLVTFSFFVLNGGESSGENVGFAITQTITLLGMVQYGIRQTAEVETQMTSVERVFEYCSVKPEAPEEEPEQTKNLRDWPNKGEIVFGNVSLEYDSQKAGPVFGIKDVNLRIDPAEKVALVGRTGSGKSSVIGALFRLSKVTGSVTVDGVNPMETGLYYWRSRLAALPQRPALFAASLRDNLDPDSVYSDAQIWEALQRVELHDLVSNLPAALNTKVGDGGGNFSSGQRQLICLARAALNQSKVLILDEATANVDSQTDKHIQQAIRTIFADSTVLTIAHRLHTVIDYDRVIVMEGGRVVESGHPYELLTKDVIKEKPTLTLGQAPLATAEIEEDPIEATYNRIRTYSSRSDIGDGRVFKSLVEQTGPTTAKMLFNMAEESYKRKMKQE